MREVENFESENLQKKKIGRPKSNTISNSKMVNLRLPLEVIDELDQLKETLSRKGLTRIGLGRTIRFLLQSYKSRKDIEERQVNLVKTYLAKYESLLKKKASNIFYEKKDGDKEGSEADARIDLITIKVAREVNSIITILQFPISTLKQKLSSEEFNLLMFLLNKKKFGEI